MSDEQELKIVPHVYIVESVRYDDLLEDRNEGTDLSEALRFLGIPVQYEMVYSKQEFKDFVETISPEYRNNTIFLPVLHISAHGNKNRIRFSNGDVIYWSELGDILTPINKRCKRSLTVVMSSCSGFNAWRSILGKKSPYFLVLGPCRDVLWSDALHAYKFFYSRFTFSNKWEEVFFKSSENPAEEIISEINDAIGEKLFYGITTLHLAELARIVSILKKHHKYS